MRYYELGVDGRVLRHYASPQFGKIVYLLVEPPEGFYMRDGVPGTEWVVDQTAVDNAAAAQAALDEEASDITTNFPDWTTISNAIDNASNVTQLKVILKKGFKVLYNLAMLRRRELEK